MKSYQPLEDGSGLVDPFVAVMGKEYDGHCRLYGKGVTKRLIKKINGSDTSYMLPGDLMESIKASAEAEKKQLADMRKELQEKHERDKAELEAIRNDIDNKMKKLMEIYPASALNTV